MHRLQALRPKDAGWNANQTGVSTLRANAPPPSPLLEKKQRRTHHPPTPSLKKSKGGGVERDHR